MKPKFKKFNDLKIEDINFNFHIHTNQTDGLSSPEEIVKEAIKLKLKAIAFTEHVNKNSNWFDDFKTRISILKKKNKKIKIFFGIESKAEDFNGNLDATKKMITNSDIVIGVVHRYPDKNRGLLSLNQIKDLGPEKSAEIEFKLARGLLNNKDIDILGHPFGIYSMFFTKLPKEYLEELFKESLKKKIAIEINTKYIIEKKLLFKLLEKINPYISIGSDVHHKKELTKSFDVIKKEIKK